MKDGVSKLNIDKLTELLNKRVSYKEIINQLEDGYYCLAINHRGPYHYLTKIMDSDCEKAIINYLRQKISGIENMIREINKCI